jgi:hypothetical protein
MRSERIKVQKSSVLTAAPTVWSRKNLEAVLVLDRRGGGEGGLLAFPSVFLGAGGGFDGNVFSRNSCLSHGKLTDSGKYATCICR